jgi:tetratricopeptide (TPR) repeat protein
MQKKIFVTLSVCSLFILSSCSKLGALSSDNFVVTPNPLETQGGQVPATINGTFPEKYMKTKATVTVIPELRYGNGMVRKGASATFQGENVYGNNQTISYRMGGHYTMKTSFPYVSDMQKSEMYLTFNAFIGKKKVEVPAVKVATGVIATSELYRKTLMNAGACIAPDSFQRVKAQKQEANVKFLINQANLRKNELKNNSVQEFVKLLKKINADREGLNIKNVEVQAYASPEGGFSFNDKLANKRQDVSEDYVKQQLKNTKVNTDIDAHYTAQDWDGFQQLVQASNIQDKDVILRVLSMYKDPEQREQQIRNMSEGFRELADGILPQLRRSRMIINYETVGRSDEQIKDLYATNPTKLSVDEMLYAASLENNADKKTEIYKRTADYFDKDYRAYNNLAVMAFNKGDESTAKQYITESLKKNPKAPEAFANLALISLKNGSLQDAENNLANAIDANGFGEVLGNMNIAKGNYAQAEDNFTNSNSNSAALAQILNKDYAAAKATLDNIKNPDGMTSYLHAILSARQGNKYAADSYLKEAIQKDKSLANYAANDLELSILNK